VGDTCGSLAFFSSMAQMQRPRTSMVGRHYTGRCKGDMYKSLIPFSSMVKIWAPPTKSIGCHLRKYELPVENTIILCRYRCQDMKAVMICSFRLVYVMM